MEEEAHQAAYYRPQRGKECRIRAHVTSNVEGRTRFCLDWFNRNFVLPKTMTFEMRLQQFLN